MNLPPSRRLASFVEPAVDEKRIDRVWAAVSEKPVRGWPAWRFAALAGAGVAAVVLGIALRPGHAASPVAAGWVVESGASDTVTLSDGTRATLHDGARLRWDRLQADRWEATVERGRVSFDVRHDASRAFVVHAGNVDLIDRGTRFDVDVEGGVVSTTVEDGRIELVREGARAALLGAGETWTSGATAPSAAGVSTAAGPATTVEVVPASPAPPGPSPSASTAAETSVKPAPSEPHAPTPQELLHEADDARLAGHPKDAAIAFDALRRRYRSDPRAGLAAFELGRLRLDALGDPSGAAEALADAVVLAPSAPFREDADARLVEAFDRMHDAGRCSAARRAYLARYPRGLHAAAVTARCP